MSHHSSHRSSGEWQHLMKSARHNSSRHSSHSSHHKRYRHQTHGKLKMQLHGCAPQQKHHLRGCTSLRSLLCTLLCKMELHQQASTRQKRITSLQSES